MLTAQIHPTQRGIRCCQVEAVPAKGFAIGEQLAPAGAHAQPSMRRAPRGEGPTVTRYAELHCLSNLSFLRGVSSATELFGRAAELGYEALAITDECSVAGIVRLAGCRSIGHQAYRRYRVAPRRRREGRVAGQRHAGLRGTVPDYHVCPRPRGERELPGQLG